MANSFVAAGRPVLRVPVFLQSLSPVLEESRYRTSAAYFLNPQTASEEERNKYLQGVIFSVGALTEPSRGVDSLAKPAQLFWKTYSHYQAFCRSPEKQDRSYMLMKAIVASFGNDVTKLRSWQKHLTKYTPKKDFRHWRALADSDVVISMSVDQCNAMRVPLGDQFNSLMLSRISGSPRMTFVERMQRIVALGVCQNLERASEICIEEGVHEALQRCETAEKEAAVKPHDKEKYQRFSVHRLSQVFCRCIDQPLPLAIDAAFAAQWIPAHVDSLFSSLDPTLPAWSNASSAGDQGKAIGAQTLAASFMTAFLQEDNTTKLAHAFRPFLRTLFEPGQVLNREWGSLLRLIKSKETVRIAIDAIYSADVPARTQEGLLQQILKPLSPSPATTQVIMLRPMSAIKGSTGGVSANADYAAKMSEEGIKTLMCERRNATATQLKAQFSTTNLVAVLVDLVIQYYLPFPK